MKRAYWIASACKFGHHFRFARSVVLPGKGFQPLPTEFLQKGARPTITTTPAERQIQIAEAS